MDQNEKRKIPVLSIILYVLAGLLVLFMVWAIINVQASIAQQNVPFSKNEFIIINYYMANVSQYGVYAIILATLGWILQKVSPATKKKVMDLNDQAGIDPTGTFADEAEELAQAEQQNVQQYESAEPATDNQSTVNREQQD